MDQLHDNALTLNGIPPMDKHPHIPPCNTKPCSNLEDRDLFAWRKCDEDIVGKFSTRPYSSCPLNKVFTGSSFGKYLVGTTKYRVTHLKVPLLQRLVYRVYEVFGVIMIIFTKYGL